MKFQFSIVQKAKQKKICKEKQKKSNTIQKEKLEKSAVKYEKKSCELLMEEEEDLISEEQSNESKIMKCEKRDELKVVQQTIQQASVQHSNVQQNENLKQIQSQSQSQQFQQQQFQQPQLTPQQLQQQVTLQQGSQNKQGTPNLQSQPGGILNYPAYSPLTMNFHTPLSYLLCNNNRQLIKNLEQSPQAQSPFDITKQHLYQSQCNQLFDDLLKSKNLTVDQLRVINRTQFPWLQKEDEKINQPPSQMSMPSQPQIISQIPSFQQPPMHQIQQFLQQQQNLQQMTMPSPSPSLIAQQIPYFQPPPEFNLNQSSINYQIIMKIDNATCGSANESFKKDFSFLQNSLSPNSFSMSPFNLYQQQMNHFQPMVLIQNPQGQPQAQQQQSHQKMFQQVNNISEVKPQIKKIKNLKDQLRNFDNIKKE